MSVRAVIVIPARLKSTRLPGKPLVDLLGTPMVIRTWQQCRQAMPDSDIYIATDSPDIKEVCDRYGAQTLMTSEGCLTGTDRVAEVAKQIDADIYINVQGDEPVFPVEDLNRFILEARSKPDQVLNGICPITEESEYRSASIPKVVATSSGKLLYMSRSAIPGNKANLFEHAWRQVCVYSFPKSALEAFSTLKEKPLLEQIEDIEILRFLELDIPVSMVPLSSRSFSVDNPEDVACVCEIIEKEGLV